MMVLCKHLNWKVICDVSNGALISPAHKSNQLYTKIVRKSESTKHHAIKQGEINNNSSELG